MKRAISVYLLFLFCIAGYCQRTLKFTDVMLYCGDTNLTVSENWDSSDSEKLGIIYVTEKRFYELLGQRRSIDIDYRTWRNERFGNGVSGTYSYLRERMMVCQSACSITMKNWPSCWKTTPLIQLSHGKILLWLLKI